MVLGKREGDEGLFLTANCHYSCALYLINIPRLWQFHKNSSLYS